MMVKYISVGKILNFHGIKGEAKIGCSRTQQDFVMSLETVYLKNGSEYKPLHIESLRTNKNVIIAKFEGIDSINDLLPHKGELLFVDEEVIRESLDEDEFLIVELVGLNVFDNADGKKLGFVIGVSNNGASDLISVKTNSKKVCLIPFVKAIVPVVDLKERKIMINNLEGLLE